MATPFSTIRMSDTVFLPLYQQGLLYYLSMHTIFLFTHNSSIDYRNVSLYSGDATFLSQIMHQKAIKFDEEMGLTQRETVFASGKISYPNNVVWHAKGQI